MEIEICVDAGESGGESVSDELATRLADSIAAVGIPARVERASVAPNRPGSKSSDPIAWGQLLLTLAASGGVLVTLIAAVKDWILRQPPNTTVKLKIGDDVLEVVGQMDQQTDLLIRAFLARHKHG